MQGREREAGITASRRSSSGEILRSSAGTGRGSTRCAASPRACSSTGMPRRHREQGSLRVAVHPTQRCLTTCFRVTFHLEKYKGVVMETGQTNHPTYSTLHFLVRHGDWVAVIIGMVPAVGGVAAWADGWSPAYAAAGILGGAFLYLIMRSYVELVRVIVDMLLPK
jgi:hypothetical protein